MIPLDDVRLSFAQELEAVLYNLERFDAGAWRAWIAGRSEAVQRLAKKRTTAKLHVLKS